MFVAVIDEKYLYLDPGTHPNQITIKGIQKRHQQAHGTMTPAVSQDVLLVVQDKAKLFSGMGAYK
jgi:hypothetical protein